MHARSQQSRRSKTTDKSWTINDQPQRLRAEKAQIAELVTDSARAAGSQFFSLDSNSVDTEMNGPDAQLRTITVHTLHVGGVSKYVDSGASH